MRKKVYICSPLRGDIEGNIKRAKEYCLEAFNAGFIPIAPHIYFTQFLDDNNPVHRTEAMELGLEALKTCDEVWVCGLRISEGMLAEIKKAAELGVPVKGGIYR